MEAGRPAQGRRGQRFPRSRRSGFAMMLVMFLIVIAGVLGFGYIYGASIRAISAQNMLHSAQARSAAESGVQYGLYLLQNDSTQVLASSKASPQGPFYADPNSTDSYLFYAEPNAGVGNTYTLDGVGTSGGISVTASMTVQTANNYYTVLSGLHPMCYWRLGEKSGTTANDEMNNHDGTYCSVVVLNQQSALPASGNPSASFNGSSSYVNTGKWDISGSAMTIVAWIYPVSASMDDDKIVCKTDPSDQSVYWSLATAVSGGNCRLRFKLRTGGITDTLVSTLGASIPVNQWSLVGAVYNGSNMILYLNGVNVGQMGQTGSITTKSTVSVYVGADPGNVGNNPWNGLLDEVAVFNRALQASDMVNLYNARLAKITPIAWND